jgi:hypothetical protein
MPAFATTESIGPLNFGEIVAAGLLSIETFFEFKLVFGKVLLDNEICHNGLL